MQLKHLSMSFSNLRLQLHQVVHILAKTTPHTLEYPRILGPYSSTAIITEAIHAVWYEIHLMRQGKASASWQSSNMPSLSAFSTWRSPFLILMKYPKIFKVVYYAYTEVIRTVRKDYPPHALDILKSPNRNLKLWLRKVSICFGENSASCVWASENARSQSLNMPFIEMINISKQNIHLMLPNILKEHPQSSNMLALNTVHNLVFSLPLQTLEHPRTFLGLPIGHAYTEVVHTSW